MSDELAMPSFNLNGKTAIITGGTRGLGWGIAATFAAFGANVVITARTEADCEKVSREIGAKYCRGGSCLGLAADSTKQADIDRVIEATEEAFGELDILVNNASITGKSANILSDYCDEENFDKVVTTNLKGVFLFSKAAASHMRHRGRGGKIINIASVYGVIGARGEAAFGAAAAGVISLTRTMANEFAQQGITVNAVCPGYIVTPMNTDILESGFIKSRLEGETALGRLAKIEDITGPVLAMASDCFNYMTGAYILLDGGQTIKG